MEEVRPGLKKVWSMISIHFSWFSYGFPTSMLARGFLGIFACLMLLELANVGLGLLDEPCWELSLGEGQPWSQCQGQAFSGGKSSNPKQVLSTSYPADGF